MDLVNNKLIYEELNLSTKTLLMAHEDRKALRSRLRNVGVLEKTTTTDLVETRVFKDPKVRAEYLEMINEGRDGFSKQQIDIRRTKFIYENAPYFFIFLGENLFSLQMQTNITPQTRICVHLTKPTNKHQKQAKNCIRPPDGRRRRVPYFG
jgi:hypothetical protein